jgi:hypothetical protein
MWGVEGFEEIRPERKAAVHPCVRVHTNYEWRCGAATTGVGLGAVTRGTPNYNVRASNGGRAESTARRLSRYINKEVQQLLGCRRTVHRERDFPFSLRAFERRACS